MTTAVTGIKVKAFFFEEVRRFVIPTPSFQVLRSTVDQLFSLTTVPYTLKYKDDEGDFITLSSDSELASAITESCDTLLRLWVCPPPPPPCMTATCPPPECPTATQITPATQPPTTNSAQAAFPLPPTVPPPMPNFQPLQTTPTQLVAFPVTSEQQTPSAPPLDYPILTEPTPQQQQCGLPVCSLGSCGSSCNSTPCSASCATSCSGSSCALPNMSSCGFGKWTTPCPSLGTNWSAWGRGSRCCKNTPSCGPLSARVLSDVTVPKGTPIEAGTVFTKTWRMLNNGKQAWPATTTITLDSFKSGSEDLTATCPQVPPALPGQEVDVTIQLVAPKTPGKYASIWKLATDGNGFGQGARLVFVVPGQKPPKYSWHGFGKCTVIHPEVAAILTELKLDPNDPRVSHIALHASYPLTYNPCLPACAKATILKKTRTKLVHLSTRD
ncbi:ZZ-type zinc finger-containing protein [Pelomyxa schiedti]|nr:ZZ-type zinc finger-containing protein [Pelomyxa schiedti]